MKSLDTILHENQSKVFIADDCGFTGFNEHDVRKMMLEYGKVCFQQSGITWEEFQKKEEAEHKEYLANYYKSQQV